MTTLLGVAGTYKNELEQDSSLQDALAQIQYTLADNQAACEAFRHQFERFAPLWTIDLSATLQVLCCFACLDINLDHTASNSLLHLARQHSLPSSKVTVHCRAGLFDN